MEIRQVQYFLSVVETGSFSAAAEELFISQSSLSKVIMALEKELAVALFDRSKRKISLTEAGQAFLEHAIKFNAAYKEMVIKLDGYRPAATPFSIAAIPVLTQYGIASLISQFKDNYPDILFSLEEIDGLNILPAVADHRFDMAFTRHNYLDQGQFTSREICKDRLLLVVSRNNRYANRSSISIRELSNDNFIVFDKLTGMHQLIMDECDKAGFEPTIFFSSHRKVSVLGLVGTNIGLALMPAKIYNYHRSADVLSIPLEEHIECNIVLAYLKNRRLQANAVSFIDFIDKKASETLV